MIFTSIINNLKTIKAKSTSLVILQITALVFGVSALVPQKADALLLIIIDHNSCWVNLIWGCGGDGGGGGGGGGGGDTTFTYESDYPKSPGTPVIVGGGPAGKDANGDTVTRIDQTRTSLKDPCTQGDTCPGDDLGALAGKISVNPAYADAKTNTCPLLWVQSIDEPNSTVECKLVTGGTSQVLPKDASGKNIFNVPVGRHVLSCTRTTTETVTKYGQNPGSAKTAVDSQTNVWKTTEDHNVRCLARPSVIEL